MQGDGLPEPGSGVDKEDAEPVIILRTASDGGEEAIFFVVFQEPYPPLDFLLALELGQTVYVTHPVCLPQQLAQRGHLSIDGGIAVAAAAQYPDQIVQHPLVERAESLAGEDLVDLAEEGPDIVLVPSLFPEEVGITDSQFADRELLDGSSLIFDRGRGQGKAMHDQATCQVRKCRKNSRRSPVVPVPVTFPA
jgi:hypothetical protein